MTANFHEEKYMSNKLTILMTLLLVFVIIVSGCANQKEQANTPSKTPQVEPSAIPSASHNPSLQIEQEEKPPLPPDY